MKFRSLPSPSRAFSGALALAVLTLLLAPAGRANAPAGHYTVAAGNVTDNLTGLVWQRSGDGQLYTFAAAKQHCAGLTGGSWRVPSIKELQTLVDDSRANPAVDATVFADAGGSNWWSSSVSGDDATLAWGLEFYAGDVISRSVTASLTVRCVR